MDPAPFTTTSDRLRRVVISFEILHDLFSAGLHPPNRYAVTKDPIPADAKLVNVQHAWPNCVELLLYSESFEPVGPGDIIPQLDILCERQPTGGISNELCLEPDPCETFTAARPKRLPTAMIDENLTGVAETTD
jgi:hypothetical protein